jgi:tRNA U34 5-methylaminomethyl-2-thiouridine-forming methyltransferase MnmC
MNLVITGDGSHSIYLPGCNEHYHSSYGAITESLHVFIRSGLHCFPSHADVSILEIGFGTGLNALLTCVDCIAQKRTIRYHALEKYPLDHSIISQLNYPSLLNPDQQPERLFNDMHRLPWNEMHEVAPGFRLQKIQDDLLRWKPDFSYNLIYFDAFAPEKQPEMWTGEIFTMLSKCLDPGGILVTYCVKGLVKQMLRKAGFSIEKLPGPPGKREILRARKLNVN